MANILASSQHSEVVGLLENRYKFKGLWGLTQFILSISRFIPDSRLKIKPLSQKEIELLPPGEAKNLEKELLSPIRKDDLFPVSFSEKSDLCAPSSCFLASTIKVCNSSSVWALPK